MDNFFYGVIEGFYGRQWSFADRHSYAGFLSRCGFDCYIYAPKGDNLFRSRWRDLLPPEHLQALLRLRAEYRSQGVRWGIGFSPLGLSEQFSQADRQLLIEKIQQLNELEPDILCVLFDDVRGDIQALADNQLSVISSIVEYSQASQHIVCPTYYSFDPVLEEIFGSMPKGYWSDLGKGLDSDIDIFWTGNQVISTSYSMGDIDQIGQYFCRKPVLWDNYPVNDGKKTSNFLNLKAYSGRPSALSDVLNGHLVNPMNQPWLSRLVLQTLGQLYQEVEAYDPLAAFEQSLVSLQDMHFANQLKADASVFQDKGLMSMSDKQRQELASIYSQFQHPAAKEIAEWLKGEYAFDPACLTG